MKFNGVSVVRYLTLILNAIFMLSGILLIALGGYAMSSKTVPGMSSTTIAAGVIVLGVLVFIVSFFGCLGAIRENRVLLIIYFGCVLLFVLIEFSLGIAAYAKRDKIPALANDNWTQLYINDRGAIEDIENTFRCCGWYNLSDRAVPPRFLYDNITCVIDKPTFNLSCNASVNNILESSLAVAGAAAIVIAVIQVICLLFSCFLFIKIPKQRDDEMLLEEATR